MIPKRKHYSRPNRDPTLGVPGKDRCPYCGQWHLTPGYCWALDSKSTAHQNPAMKRLQEKYATKDVSELAVTVITDMVTDVTAKSQAVTDTKTGARLCVVCGEPMPETARADARFCSAACRQRAHRTK